VSGQVNTAVMAWDDGLQEKVYIVDNGVSRSGFNFDGTARINPNLTAGFQMVIGLAAGARTHQVTQWDDDGGADGDSTFAIELANWFLRSDTLGEIRVGRINTAQSGTTLVDLGGAGVIANANFGLWQSGMFVNVFGAQLGTGGDPDGAGPLTTSTPATWNTLLGGSFVSVSGLSRQNAIMYTTPTLAGFSASAAYGEDEFWDVAGRYAGEFAGFRVAAAASYSVNRDTEPDGVVAPLTEQDIRKWQGSASVMHVASGLYLSGAYINLSYHGDTFAELSVFGGNRPDTTAWYLQGGVSKNWTGLGNTVLYGEYGRIDDGAAGVGISVAGSISTNAATIAAGILSSEASFWGLGVVQHVDAAAMEVFLSYRQYSADAVVCVIGCANIPVEDFSAVIGGARVRF
jgi:hypothetical protein